ncbi:MAG TPA: histidinol-phosphate transaminase [Gemmatimonadaceae bacterium]|nr:histidinol-phosphate transaminase [Gemmatimonadaceae bacterium]
MNAYGPAPNVRVAIMAASVEAYPDIRCMAPREAAAVRWNRPVSEIACGAGTAELIHALVTALIRPGDGVLIPRPAFAEYGRAALLAGARIHRAKHDDMIAAIRRHQPKLAFIASPTSPTGAPIAREIVSACAETGALVVLDQAYDAFTSEPLGTPALPGHPNVLHLRSLTKDHALAGVRVGFAIGPAATIEAMNRVRVPWMVSAPAQAAAIAALTDEAEAHVCRTIALLRESAAGLWAWCDQVGIERVPSDTHYGIIRTRARGIMVRDCTSFGLPGWIRVAVRTQPENAVLRRGLVHG